MNLPMSVASAVKDTMEFCASSIYLEPSGGIHSEITPGVYAWIKQHVTLIPGQRILDIGPGPGTAMDLFQVDGLEAIGITASAEECVALNASGKTCIPMDMHQIWNFDGFFNACFARHCLEHSFAPLLMLRGIHRALKPGGWIYAEFPGISTACAHETNPNHFSVLSKAMWRKLILDAGFTLIDEAIIQFEVEAGPDEYYSFLAVHA